MAIPERESFEFRRCFRDFFGYHLKSLWEAPFGVLVYFQQSLLSLPPIFILFGLPNIPWYWTAAKALGALWLLFALAVHLVIPFESDRKYGVLYRRNRGMYVLIMISAALVLWKPNTVVLLCSLFVFLFLSVGYIIVMQILFLWGTGTPFFANEANPEMRKVISNFFRAYKKADMAALDEIFNLFRIRSDKQAFLRSFPYGRFGIINVNVTALDGKSARLDFQMPSLNFLVRAVLQGGDDIRRVTNNLLQISKVGGEYVRRSEEWYFVAEGQKLKIDFEKTKVLKFVSLNGDLIYSYFLKGDRFLNSISPSGIPFRISSLIAMYMTAFEIDGHSPDGSEVARSAVACAKSAIETR